MRRLRNYKSGFSSNYKEQNLTAQINNWLRQILKLPVLAMIAVPTNTKKNKPSKYT